VQNRLQGDRSPPTKQPAAAADSLAASDLTDQLAVNLLDGHATQLESSNNYTCIK
jgi:hypothetical protein